MTAIRSGQVHIAEHCGHEKCYPIDYKEVTIHVRVFSRGASIGGQDASYFSREDVTAPAGVGSATGSPGGVADENLGKELLEQQGVIEKEGIEYDPKNPYIARAVPQEGDELLDKTAGTNSPVRADESYQQII